MERSILRFPDENGTFTEAGIRNPVPALLLMEAKDAAGTLGFPLDNGERHPLFCFITPRIEEMYSRLEINGVKILKETLDNNPNGRNVRFCDPDGNVLELWEPVL